MKPLSDCSLYTFVDSAYLNGRDPVVVTQQLCAGGADLVQLRAKDWAPERILHVARAINEVTTRYSVRLVINDHLAIAQEVGAEICHLGREDFFDAGFTNVSELTEASPKPAIGLSTHSPEQARRAITSGPAYIAIGPVFATGTKPSAQPVTLEYVQWAAENVQIPWFAIGGITLRNLGSVLAAGATRICVVSAILQTEDVAAACRQFKTALGVHL